MNTLYEIVYPGSYIPWGILVLYYFFHYQFCDMLACSTYVIIALITISHKDYGKSVLHWESLNRICDFALIIRLILLNTLNSSFIALTAAITICLLGGKTLKQQHRFAITQPILYGVCVLFLCSSSSSKLQQVAALSVVALKMIQSNMTMKCHSAADLTKRMTNYFHLKIIESYLIFMMEWTSAKNLHWLSIIIIIFLSVMFQMLAYYDVPYESQNVDEFYMNIHKLPENYPIPLNFRHARERSKVFSQVFKQHNI